MKEAQTNREIIQSEKFKPIDRMTWTDGWLAPDGRFYPCTSTEHNDCATHIFSQNKDQFLDMVSRNSGRSVADLIQTHPRFIIERAGFLRLSASEFGSNTSPDELTAAQLKTVLLSPFQVGQWIYTPPLPSNLFDPANFKTTVDNHKKLADFSRSPRAGFFVENNSLITQKVWQRIAGDKTGETATINFDLNGLDGQLNYLPAGNGLALVHTHLDAKDGETAKDFIVYRTQETLEWLAAAVHY